jgi:hypothetical protein
MPDSFDTWLLLIHQLPTKPDYLRVKVRRRLQRIGAVAIKSTVYVLPDREQQAEDLAWLAQEIESDGGEAYVCKAGFVAGLTDDAIVRLFHAARNEDYANLARSLEELLAEVIATLPNEETIVKLRGEVGRFRQMAEEIAAIDFFEAGGRGACIAVIEQLEARTVSQKTASSPEVLLTEFCGRTWVTRANVFVDRMASAWLIRRYIDPEARFRFVDPATYRHAPGELRFDMFDGEYTHVGEHCTFEVLRESFGVEAPGVAAIAEIVHDIDLKDARYNRPETAGVQAVLAGIRAGNATDDLRLQQGMPLFDALRTQLAAGGASHG